MGRPPSNGGPTFRFIASEVAEMEAILQEHQNAMPAREVLVALAEKFSESTERKGKIIVQMKQVWNWFQNRRYAIRAKSSKTPVKLNASPMSRDESTPVRSGPQPVVSSIPASMPAPMATPSVPSAGRRATENSYMEFEVKSARDGAWYDVGTFLSHRHLDTGDPEVLVRFAGFGPDEDEWVNIRKNVRQRSLPCEASECVAVLPGDLILCFQEGKDQALYYDAHVLDAQRRRHDVRGCRCRFLVRYDHDLSEEIVPLRKVCRRPETDYRLQQLHAANDSSTTDQQKTSTDPSTPNVQRLAISNAETMQRQRNVATTDPIPILHANISQPAKTMIPETKTVETSNTENVGHLSVLSSTNSSTVGNPTSAVNVGNTSVSTKTSNVGNPTSAVNVGNTSVLPANVVNAEASGPAPKC